MVSNGWKFIKSLWHAGSFLVWSCTSSPPQNPALQPTLEDPFLQAERLLEKKDTLRALALLRKKIQSDSTNPYLYQLLGNLYYMRAQDDSALIFLQRSQYVGGNNPHLDHQLGNVYFMLKKYDLARHHYRRAIEGDSTVLEFWIALGVLEFMQKNYKEAEKIFSQALKLDSLAEKPINFLFEIYTQGYGDWERARKHLAERLLRKDPFHPLGNFLTGLYFENLYQKTKQTAHARKAIRFFTQAVLAKPDYAQALYHRAYLYFEVKKYEAAAEDLGDYLRLRPTDGRAYFLLGSIYEFWGKKVLACENYHKAWLYDSSFIQARQAWEEVCH